MRKIYSLLSLIVLFILFAPFPKADAAFSDVNPKEYYAEPIQWALQQKIVSGFPDNTFRPDDQVSEEQFIKIYTNFFQFTPSSTALQGEHWSNVFYRTLDHYNIQVLGTNETHFKDKPINRGAVAELLGYAQGTNRDALEAIQFLYDKELTNGKYPDKKGLLAQYGAAESLTRGELVTFLYRMNKDGFNKLHPTVAAASKSNLPNNDFTKKYKDIFLLQDDLYVGVLNDDYKKLNLELFIGETAVAGYFTQPNQQVNSLTIGKHYSSGEPFTEVVGDKRYTYYFDQLNKNKLIGVYWAFTSFDEDAYFKGAKAPADTVAFSKLGLLLVNEFRAKNNLDALHLYEPVAHVSYKHALDMFKQNYEGHFNKQGLSPDNRVDVAGIYYDAIQDHKLVGENIAKIPNENGLFAAHNGWINSPIHRQHILYTEYTHIGLGLTNEIYTMMFITPQY